MINTTQTLSSKVLDSAGIVLSCLCIAHCLFLPVAVSLLPIILGDALVRPETHWAMLAAVAPIATYALWKGYRHHEHNFVLIAGAAGLVTLLAAHPLAHALGSHQWETILTVAGGFCVSAAHARNLWACHRCDYACHRPAEAATSDPSAPSLRDE